MLTRMARTGGGSHGSIPLRLHQRNGPACRGPASPAPSAPSGCNCGQAGRQHESGHVSDTSAAAGGHIAAGRGRACGWRVTDPARRALTRLKVSSRGGPALPSGRVPAICSVSGPRSGPAPPRAGTDLAVTLHLTCSAIVRLRGERDDRAGCPPRRHAGTGTRRYGKSRREGGRSMAHAAGPHRPAARSAAACHRPP